MRKYHIQRGGRGFQTAHPAETLTKDNGLAEVESL